MVFSNYAMIVIMLMFMHVGVYVCHVWQDFHGSWLLMLTFICIHVSMYVIVSHEDDCFMLMIIYACMYVSMSQSDRVVRDCSCGGIISYAGEWHEEIPSSWGFKWEE